MSTEYLRDRLLTLQITNKLTANNVQLHDVRDMATVAYNGFHIYKAYFSLTTSHSFCALILSLRSFHLLYLHVVSKFQNKWSKQCELAPFKFLTAQKHCTTVSSHLFIIQFDTEIGIKHEQKNNANQQSKLNFLSL